MGLTFRRCKACRELAQGIHFMLRAAVLLSFLRRIQRFSTSSHPEARLAPQARCLLRGGLTLTATGLHVDISTACVDGANDATDAGGVRG